MLVAHYEIQLAPGASAPPGEIEVIAGLTLGYVYLVVHPFTCVG